MWRLSTLSSGVKWCLMTRHCNGVCMIRWRKPFLVKQRGLGSNVFSADSFEGFNRTKKWLFICDSLSDKTPNCSHCCDFISTSYNPFYNHLIFALPAGILGVLFCYYSGYVFDKTIYLPNVNCNAPSKTSTLSLLPANNRYQNRKCIGAEALLRWPVSRGK